MIQDIYLKKAYDIKREYLSILGNLKEYEHLSKMFISSISSSIDELKKLNSNIESKKVKDPDSAQNELQKIVMKTEEDINKIDESVKSLNKRIDELKEEELNLYKEIKRRHTNLNDDEIKKIVNNYLEKKSNES
jgi:uncharacterized protein YlxW (UPF0749 family)